MSSGMPSGAFDARPPSGAERLRDAEARRAAVDPTRNVVLEASAGTGKTRVLVDRYVGLIRAGVDPVNILAITFTRKAAAEMRQRIVDELRASAARSPEDAVRWRGLRDRLDDIAVSTIDAFCLSLLREFPLEADLDPGFDVADETEVPRLVEESLDQALRICRGRARTDEGVALLFTQLGEPRLREGLASLLNRRIVAGSVLQRVLANGPRDLTIARACAQGAIGLADALRSVPDGLDRWLENGPVGHPRYALLVSDVRALVASGSSGTSGDRWTPGRLRDLIERLRAHVFTKAGKPRQRAHSEFLDGHYASAAARKAHWPLVYTTAPAIDGAVRALRRDLNVILSRAVWQVFSISIDRYLRTLDVRGVVDFAELLVRARGLLGEMDEFARSRYLLEARYHHVLVDEFQDTSRAQWELVSQLVRTWGEGAGLAHEAPLPPSIFVVGDRKQSIYGFRDAEVTVFDDAAAFVGALRSGEEPLKSISHSFRSVPAILAFANDVFGDVEKLDGRADSFRYDDRDTFPQETDPSPQDDDGALGIVAGPDVTSCAAAVAAEVARLLGGAAVRDRATGERRPVRPGDMAILFRSRVSHRDFERALESRGIPTYVYKGLGFFDADEIKDIVALLRYLAEPTSNLRAAALLRSRFVRLSDSGLQRLAPALARALIEPRPPVALTGLDGEDRRFLELARTAVPLWLDLADRIPPAELLDRVIADTAYMYELRGSRVEQARENVKKIRSLVRRIQNRGYVTLGRLASHLDQMSTGDESNAVIDALDAVNLMTVHAAKGLEFPVVFLVNLSKGSGGWPEPIRVSAQASIEEAVSVGDYRTEIDEDGKARDSEETKRLLYVAVTRARDRLYLSSVVAAHTFKPGPGSLAQVLPDSLKEIFEKASATDSAGAEIAWTAASGATHRLRVCTDPSTPLSTSTRNAVHDRLSAHVAGSARSAPREMEREGEAQPEATRKPIRKPIREPIWITEPPGSGDDFSVLLDSAAPTRAPVTAAVRLPESEPDRPPASPDRTRAVVGRLVHRLFQASASGDDEAQLVTLARRLLRSEDLEAVADATSAVQEAASLFASMRNQPGVTAAIDGAQCLYEVPVSVVREAGAREVLRGVIDCVVLRPDGNVVVLDFKTGAPRESDQRQLEIYVAAAKTLFPGSSVTGQLVYATSSQD